MFRGTRIREVVRRSRSTACFAEPGSAKLSGGAGPPRVSRNQDPRSCPAEPVHRVFRGTRIREVVRRSRSTACFAEPGSAKLSGGAGPPRVSRNQDPRSCPAEPVHRVFRGTRIREVVRRSRSTACFAEPGSAKLSGGAGPPRVSRNQDPRSCPAEPVHRVFRGTRIREVVRREVVPRRGDSVGSVLSRHGGRTSTGGQCMTGVVALHPTMWLDDD